MRTSTIVTTLFLLALNLSAEAFQPTGNMNSGNPQNNQGPNANGQNGQRKQPPQQAIAACQGKAVGAACNFVGPRGFHRTGTCGPMACRPDKPANGQQGNQQQQRPQGRN